jgi:hypothetical protein
MAFFGSYEDNFINPNIQIAYAYNFTSNESASFLAFVEQLQTESELVHSNLANNNVSLAQAHANKAAALLTPNITEEFAEENQRVANDLRTAINSLQNISSRPLEKQSVDLLVNDIDSILEEAVTTRIEQEQRNNATIQALALVDLTNMILEDYGNAYAVRFDMTNMSDMAIMGSNNNSMVAKYDMSAVGNNNNMSMSSVNNSSNMRMNMGSGGETNKSSSIVNMSSYRSAQALAAKAMETYDSELEPIAPRNAAAFLANLENGLTQLNDAVRNKTSPMDIMVIIHTQVQPSLLQAFGLELR